MRHRPYTSFNLCPGAAAWRGGALPQVGGQTLYDLYAWVRPSADASWTLEFRPRGRAYLVAAVHALPRGGSSRAEALQLQVKPACGFVQGAAAFLKDGSRAVAGPAEMGVADAALCASPFAFATDVVLLQNT